MPLRPRTPPQGCMRTAVNHCPPQPPFLDPDFIVGKNEMHKRKYWIGLFLVHKLLGSRPPPPSLFSYIPAHDPSACLFVSMRMS